MCVKMKITVIICLFLTLAMVAHTQEAYIYFYDDDETIEEPEEIVVDEPEAPVFIAVFEPIEWEDPVVEEPEQETPPARRRGLRNRTFELSLANVNVNASNNNISAGDIFQETAVIDLDAFFSGIKLDFDAAIKPLSININIRDRWGFGFDFGHMQVFGNLSVSGSLLDGLAEAEDDRFGVGAAVFADVLGLPVFFHVNNLKVRIRPAAYMPVFYTIPGVTYNRSGTSMSIDYNMRIYSLINLQSVADGGDMDINDIINPNNMGYDFTLGFEYPLLSQLDLGVNIVNIPLPYLGGKLNHYMHLEDRVSFDSSKISFDDLINGKISEDAYYVPDGFDPDYGSETIVLYRPFKTVFYANYRPFKTYLFTLIPSLGFSYNELYPQNWGPEGGLSMRVDLGNIFITTLGINYNDRVWKNSLDFSLNFRAMQIDFGASLQSPNFVKSFQGSGLGVNVGLKLGW